MRISDWIQTCALPIFDIEAKADASPVTIADRAAETAMRTLIAAERPNDGIIGEEYGALREGAELIWVLDPIDGTRSFIAGRPTFGPLLALLQDRSEERRVGNGGVRTCDSRWARCK